MKRIAPLLSFVLVAALLGCAGGDPTAFQNNSTSNNSATPNNTSFNANPNNTSNNNGEPDPSCSPAACIIGQTICSSVSEVQECYDNGQGCGVFGPHSTCTGGQRCSDGRCSDGCTDNDGDGHGNGCANGPDCDDNDPDKNMNRSEACDSKDNDCDNIIDEGDACAAGCAAQECEPNTRECDDATHLKECRGDQNGCGFWSSPLDCGGACANGQCEGNETCIDNDGDQRGEGCPFGGDCDDNDPDRFEGGTEVCDSKDNNCNNMIDEGDVCQNDCSDQPCAPPMTVCVGNSIRECVADENGCGQWGNTTACEGECMNGACAGCNDNDGDGRGQGMPPRHRLRRQQRPRLRRRPRVLQRRRRRLRQPHRRGLHPKGPSLHRGRRRLRPRRHQRVLPVWL